MREPAVTDDPARPVAAETYLRALTAARRELIVRLLATYGGSWNQPYEHPAQRYDAAKRGYSDPFDDYDEAMAQAAAALKEAGGE